MDRISNLPKKYLVKISEKLIDEGDIDFNTPYESYELIYDTLLGFSKFFSIKYVSNEDVEFICKFISDNDDSLSKIFTPETSKEEKSKLIESLYIPKIKNFDVEYYVLGNAVVTEYFSTTVQSVSKEFAREQIYFDYNNDNFDYWEGDRTDLEYSNFELEEFKIQSIFESSRVSIKESKSVIDQLDKKTLLELKKVIDNRLSRL